MYIIELIVKKFLNKNKALSITQEKIEEEKCEHVFLPIDSTADYLACNKCGFVVKNDKSKNKNNENKNFFAK